MRLRTAVLIAAIALPATAGSALAQPYGYAPHPPPPPPPVVVGPPVVAGYGPPPPPPPGWGRGPHYWWHGRHWHHRAWAYDPWHRGYWRYY